MFPRWLTLRYGTSDPKAIVLRAVRDHTAEFKTVIGRMVERTGLSRTPLRDRRDGKMKWARLHIKSGDSAATVAAILAVWGHSYGAALNDEARRWSLRLPIGQGVENFDSAESEVHNFVFTGTMAAVAVVAICAALGALVAVLVIPGLMELTGYKIMGEDFEAGVTSDARPGGSLSADVSRSGASFSGGITDPRGTVPAKGGEVAADDSGELSEDTVPMWIVAAVAVVGVFVALKGS